MRSVVWVVLCAAVVCAAQLAAHADVTSDQPAAILVFPRVVVDSSAMPQISPPARMDTLIRVSNTSNRPISLKCFYVNATPHCSNASGSCLSGTCVPMTECKTQWQETDFFVTLTARQPIGWLASRGIAPCESSDTSGLPCLPLNDNADSRINPVPEDPFVGELKCIAVDKNFAPVERNELKGEVEIVRSGPASIDVEGYNAIGIPAIPGTNNFDDTLVLGGGVCIGGSKAKSPCASADACPGGTCSAEYSGCPNVLILDHFFDGAMDTASNKVVTTTLTLVPCNEDFATQQPINTTVHFLVFNEFEQRFSTSRIVTCFQEFKLADIDRATKDKSIFSATVNGTLTGQTRINGLADTHLDHGHTLLGVAEEFRDSGGTAAFNLHFQGGRPQSDFIKLPPSP